jgi:hypothetical protein
MSNKSIEELIVEIIKERGPTPQIEVCNRIMEENPNVGYSDICRSLNNSDKFAMDDSNRCHLTNKA